MNGIERTGFNWNAFVQKMAAENRRILQESTARWREHRQKIADENRESGQIRAEFWRNFRK